MEDDVERSQFARVVEVCVSVRRFDCSIDVHWPAFDVAILGILFMAATSSAF